MAGLAQLVQAATWPQDCPERRAARALLVAVAGAWLLIITGPVLVVLSLASGKH